MNNIPVIARTAMLATLNIRQWSGRKLDREVSQELNASKGSDQSVARVNKLLVSKGILDPLATLASTIRQRFYEVTLPWGQDGSRILPAAAYMDFSNWLADRQNEWEEAVVDFLSQYRQEVMDAARRMGGMFKIEDYPKPSELAGRWGVTFSVRPIPTEHDFRVSLSDAVEASIKSQVRDEITELTEAASRHLLANVKQQLEAVHERMSDPDARFRHGLLDNYVDMVKSLRTMNVGQSPEIDMLCDELLATLHRVRDPDTLRKDPIARRQLADSTGEVLDRFKGIWG